MLLPPCTVSQPGFVKMERTVCKGEWAYEVQVVYGAEHFGAFMESGKADALDALSSVLYLTIHTLHYPP